MRPDSFSMFLRACSLWVLFGILGALYWWEIRPAQLHWGASPAEIARSMPDDQAVEAPAFDATRAITIRATPEQIWPWVIQMGFGRAGFYGYDLIENVGSGSGIRSATTIMPALQNPRPGDILPLSVAATLAFGPMERNRFVVWRSTQVPCDGVFIWELIPLDRNHTRLISRIRWNFVKDPQGYALGVFTEFADHVAVRKILEGIRDRAENVRPEPLALQLLELGSWCIAGVSFAVSVICIGFWRRWGWAWLMALGAGLLLELVLYGSMPAGIRILLPMLYLLGIALAEIRTRQSERAARFFST